MFACKLVKIFYYKYWYITGVVLISSSHGETGKIKRLICKKIGPVTVSRAGLGPPKKKYIKKKFV